MTTEVSNSRWSVTIAGYDGAPEPDTDDPLFVGLQAACLAWKEEADVVELAIARVSADQFSWQITHADGRTWESALFVGSTVQLCQWTHNTGSDRWFERETCGAYRQVVDCGAKLLIGFDLASIDCTWMPG
jgi:hypothetical protein